MKILEKQLKAIADKNRLRILKLLGERPMCVCELAAVIGITQPSVSRHLKKLKLAGLIQDEQKSFWSDYYIARSGALQTRALLRCISTWLNDDETVKKDIGKSSKVDRAKLCCPGKNRRRGG